MGEESGREVYKVINHVGHWNMESSLNVLTSDGYHIEDVKVQNTLPSMNGGLDYTYMIIAYKFVD